MVDVLDNAVGAQVKSAGGNLIGAEAAVAGEGKVGVTWSPLSERSVTRHPQRGVYRSTRMSAVPEARNGASAVA